MDEPECRLVCCLELREESEKGPGTDFCSDRNDIPEEHYAVWYGETNSTNLPRCRTVPMEYCLAATVIEYYH